MKPAAPIHKDNVPTAVSESESTGLPGFRTWSSVYWLVTAMFVVTVGLLAWLTRMFS